MLNRIPLLVLNSFLNTDQDDNISRFGSSYGGWSICVCPHHILANEYLVSAGVGEDISFDIEVIEKFGLNAILIDPTIRARKHVYSYLKELNRSRKKDYSQSGKQHLSSYPVSGAIKNKIRFVNQALWTDDNGLELCPPADSNNVSFHLYKTKNSIITEHFPSVNQRQILTDASGSSPLNTFSIYKLDVEGSELFLLRDFAKMSFLPRQLLVEFDFLRGENKFSQAVYLWKLLSSLSKKGYRLAYREGLNCTFLTYNRKL